jgi:divinyl protochlorophyllide a 8-vinyl-reductase
METNRGLIGPNAIIQVQRALEQLQGTLQSERVFADAALARHLVRSPQCPVPEQEVQQLHIALRHTLGEIQAEAVAREAGLRTARYLLTHRIPGPAQVLLRRLPARLALPPLLRAMQGQAWTFAGSGHFNSRMVWRGPTLAVLSIRNNPLCRGLHLAGPACAYYAATFEHLMRTLVHAHCTVVETACEAMGAPACRFEVRLPAGTGL